MKRALLLLPLVLLAGCGRTGPPRPPGPNDQVVFPRAYPTPPEGTRRPTTTNQANPMTSAPPLSVPGGR